MYGDVIDTCVNNKFFKTRIESSTCQNHESATPEVLESLGEIQQMLCTHTKKFILDVFFKNLREAIEKSTTDSTTKTHIPLTAENARVIIPTEQQFVREWTFQTHLQR